MPDIKSGRLVLDFSYSHRTQTMKRFFALFLASILTVSLVVEPGFSVTATMSELSCAHPILTDNRLLLEAVPPSPRALYPRTLFAPNWWVYLKSCFAIQNLRPDLQNSRTDAPPGNVSENETDGYIAGNSVTAQQKKEIQAAIRGGNMEVVEYNRRAVIAVEAAYANILAHKKDRLIKLLKEYGVTSPLDIDRVIRMLTESPLVNFNFFKTTSKLVPLYKKNDPDWYYLGDSQSLAVDIIYYLMKREQEGAGIDLLEEYVLHELLENFTALGKNSKQRHIKIITLTQRLFDRAPVGRSLNWRGRTVLGTILREYIDLRRKEEIAPESEAERVSRQPILWSMLRRMMEIPDSLALLQEDKYQLLLGLVGVVPDHAKRREMINQLIHNDPDLALSIDLLIAQFKPYTDAQKQAEETNKTARRIPILHERPEVWLDAAFQRAAAYKGQDYMSHFLKSIGLFIRYLTKVSRKQDGSETGTIFTGLTFTLSAGWEIWHIAHGGPANNAGPALSMLITPGDWGGWILPVLGAVASLGVWLLIRMERGRNKEPGVLQITPSGSEVDANGVNFHRPILSVLQAA